MGRRWWALVRVAAGAAVLGVLAWRVGTEPFVAGLRRSDRDRSWLPWCWLRATTVCTAERWRLVARTRGRHAHHPRGRGGLLPLPVPQLGAARRDRRRRAPGDRAPHGPVGGRRAGARARPCRSPWGCWWSWSRGPPTSGRPLPARRRTAGGLSSLPGLVARADRPRLLRRRDRAGRARRSPPSPPRAT